MSSAERQQLFEVLATLTGLQDGPTGKFSDGTRFEYDRKLGRTVEVTLAGKRFPVMLVAGKFQRESETAVTRKTRSEEHTSELQSRLHLVCRLLLENKKKCRL